MKSGGDVEVAKSESRTLGSKTELMAYNRDEIPVWWLAPREGSTEFSREISQARWCGDLVIPFEILPLAIRLSLGYMEYLILV